MLQLPRRSFWFITGSQHLYGQDAIRKVGEHAQLMARSLDHDPEMPYSIHFKLIATSSDVIIQACVEANGDDQCAGVILWMHTFSPAKMWIAGLSELRKPILHLHTQYNRDIPWESIDMDFMNLNQSAHGDREFGYIGARMRKTRQVVAGHWEDPEARRRIGSWMRVAMAVVEGRRLKVARFGDNMREVAVTEGDKVEAQLQLGWSINGYGIGELVQRMDEVSDAAVDSLCQEYGEMYEIAAADRNNPGFRESVREQARIELALKTFLQAGNFGAFTTTFEDLHGMKQLPGLAVQRLMAEGYGFGGEGDWKTAALVRIMKMIADSEGTSFMEDYTYHIEPGQEMVLGAHMLEVCPSIAASRPRLEVHPLSIGGKSDPARLVFDGSSGLAVNASLIDMGNRFRLLVNEVNAVAAERAMPKLPVARVLWQPYPSLRDSAEAWILAGGAHHTCFSYGVTADQLSDYAHMSGIECLVIDQNTSRRAFQNELQLRDMMWTIRQSR